MYKKKVGQSHKKILLVHDSDSIIIVKKLKMQTENIFISHPSNIEQLNALKAE